MLSGAVSSALSSTSRALPGTARTGTWLSVKRSSTSSSASVACQAASSKAYDYDVCIIGCGVGGHGAALHAVQQGEDARLSIEPLFSLSLSLVRACVRACVRARDRPASDRA